MSFHLRPKLQVTVVTDARNGAVTVVTDADTDTATVVRDATDTGTVVKVAKTDRAPLRGACLYVLHIFLLAHLLGFQVEELCSRTCLDLGFGLTFGFRALQHQRTLSCNSQRRL